jgi:hypothetical protein
MYAFDMGTEIMGALGTKFAVLLKVFYSWQYVYHSWEERRNGYILSAVVKGAHIRAVGVSGRIIRKCILE